MADFLPGLTLAYTPGKENVVPDALSHRPDYLCNIATGVAPVHAFVMSDFLVEFSVTQRADAKLGRYWRLAQGESADYCV